MCWTPRSSFCGWKSPVIADTRLAMFLARSPTRSRSLARRSAPTISRRSTAMGWRRAMVSTALSSISCCRASTPASAATTRAARSMSRLASASTESAICFSTRPPISATMRVSSCRSTSKAFAVCSFMTIVLSSPSRRQAASAEATGDVVLRAPVARRGEYLAGGVELDHLAEIHEGGEIGNPGGLLHIVGDDRDRVVFLQLVDQLFDLGGRDRIERRAGLVEQDHFRLDGDGAGDAQPLLLPAGEAQAVGVELSLHLLPERGAAQRRLDAPVELRLGQLFIEPDAERDILVDRHRERCRFLEHHPDAGAQQVEILLGRKNVLAVEQDLALGALVGIEVVHPVEDAQQGRFATTRRPDERHDLAGVERQVDVLEGLALTVVEIQALDRNLLVQGRGVDRGVGDGGNGGGCDIHDCFLDAESVRAMML